jgi:hypothetical protein
MNFSHGIPVTDICAWLCSQFSQAMKNVLGIHAPDVVSASTAYIGFVLVGSISLVAHE